MDDWFYMHDGTVGGPVPIATLRAMAAEGRLAPEDAVWAKGAAPAKTALAGSVVPFPHSAARQGAVPDWLGDVKEEERRATPAGGPARPDWLEGVRQAEKAEAASGIAPTVGPVSKPGPRRRGKAPPSLPPTVPAALGPPLKAAGDSFPVVAGQGKLEIGSATSPGVVRPVNEDSFLVLRSSWGNLDRRHEMAVVVVADGMGGHQAGERASGLVISAMGEALAPLLAGAVMNCSATTASAFPPAIDLAFGQAHRAVSEAGKADALCKDMGATAAVVLLLDDAVHIGLVGDCRVYHQRGDWLSQVTRDQTIVARMVELGQLTPEEAANHPRSNEVTQAVGLRGAIQPVRYERTLRPGDWMIVCCDGLYAHVGDELLQDTIGLWAASPDALAHHLVELANRRGGSDNCTVVAILWDGA
jgi:serine/threonine protein phosphatase PrpC